VLVWCVLLIYVQRYLFPRAAKITKAMEGMPAREEKYRQVRVLC
jgi:hypothetical protein